MFGIFDIFFSKDNGLPLSVTSRVFVKLTFSSKRIGKLRLQSCSVYMIARKFQFISRALVTITSYACMRIYAHERKETLK